MGFLDQVKGFGRGAWDGVKGTVDGIKTAVTDPVGTVKGLGHAVTHPGDTWDAIKKPYTDAWGKGEYGRAIGMGTVEALTAIVGTKGADKAVKAAKAAKAARAANIVDETADAGRVADKTADAARVADQTADVARVTQSPAAKAATEEALKHVPGPERLKAAAQFRPHWAQASLDDAVRKLGPVDVSATESGKVLYKAKNSTKQVVHDPHSNYFRVEDTSLPGKRRYLDQKGDPVPNNIKDPVTGKERGMSQAEYNARTHFRMD